MPNNTKRIVWTNWGFWTLYALVFVGIAHKAFTVPITHDEGWTVIKYLDASFWDIMMYPDNWPNNHILNTLLAKISAGIFGVSDWSVRLPNLLFFWVYAFGVFRFLKEVLKDRMVLFIPVSLLFVLSPYFLDFFGLCRGYGISSALTMVSLSYFVTGFASVQQKHIWKALIFALVASYANFTVLLYFAAACLIAAFYFFLHKKSWGDALKNWGIQIAVFVGYVALIAVPIYKMKSTDQFEFWTSKGFYEETVFSVIHNSLTDSSLYTRHEWFAVLVVILTIGLWLLCVWKIVRSEKLLSALKSPLVIVGGVLLVTVSINLLQTIVLDDPNLNGRTALFLLPIFLALVGCGIALLPEGKRRWVSIATGVFLFLVTFQHLAMSYRPNSFKEWRFDEHTDEVIAFLESKASETTIPLISVDWLYFNSFEFYSRYQSSDRWTLLLTPNLHYTVDNEAYYCYVPKEVADQMQDQFEVVKRFDGGQTLMRNRSN